jgi:hypothetical protein
MIIVRLSYLLQPPVVVSAAAPKKLAECRAFLPYISSHTPAEVLAAVHFPSGKLTG